jgi:copper chaperone
MSTTTEYVVSGMTCAHCVQAVTEEVSGLSGVTDVAVDLTSGALTVVSEADLLFDDVERAVDEAGYTVSTR